MLRNLAHGGLSTVLRLEESRWKHHWLGPLSSHPGIPGNHAGPSPPTFLSAVMSQDEAWVALGRTVHKRRAGFRAGGGRVEAWGRGGAGREGLTLPKVLIPSKTIKRRRETQQPGFHPAVSSLGLPGPRMWQACAPCRSAKHLQETVSASAILSTVTSSGTSPLKSSHRALSI